MSSTIEKLNFSVFLILIDLNLNIPLAASILDNVVLDVEEVFSERMKFFIFGTEGMNRSEGQVRGRKNIRI